MWRPFSFGKQLCGALLCATLVLTSHEGSAQTWNVVLNGKAIHVGATRDWNEENWGLGFELEFRTGSRWVTAVLANGFRDSDDEASYMAGGSIKRRFPLAATDRDFYFDVGVAGFLMTREDVQHNRRFPALLPAVTIGTRNYGVNLTYVPMRWANKVIAVSRADPGIEGIYFIQVKLAPSALRWKARDRRRASVAVEEESDERVNRKVYRTRDEARADVSD